MSKKLHRQIRYLAEKVRRATENLSRDEEGQFSLSGYCGRASALLSTELYKRSIPHKLVYSDWGHIYVECHGYIIDTTATQFSSKLPQVMMRKREALEFICKANTINMNWWRRSRIFESVAGLHNWQIKEHWPDGQMISNNDTEYLVGVWNGR